MLISSWKSLETPMKEVSVFSWILIHSYRTEKQDSDEMVKV